MSLIDRIKTAEMCVLTAYHDSLGWPTQGWGHLLPGDKWCDLDQFAPIDQATADKWLEEDIEAATIGVAEHLPWTANLSDVRRGVLVEMAFQMGVAGLLEFTNTLAACERGNYAQAAAGMRASKWYTQTPKRCEKLAMIMQTGIDE